MLPVFWLALGCAGGGVPSAHGRSPFRFSADTFAFANETVMQYDFDPVTHDVSSHPKEKAPEFALRCGAMARAARQFYSVARFDPSVPVADDPTYEHLVREVLATDPRDPPDESVVIPGYRDLRALSEAHASLLKGLLAGPWETYLQRGNWRMVFPFGPDQQQQVAGRLLDELARGWPPIVHVLRFPERTINHLVLVFDAEETPAEIRFRVYDPNDAERPVELVFDRGARIFSYSATSFFPGGPVKAYEVYDGWLY
jgi:hypothetical protein